MLLVRTYIERSAIHGFGLFAGEPIPAGAQVWRLTPGFDLALDPEMLGSLPTWQRERLLHYGYLDKRLNRFVLCCDDARFINHSTSPNIRPDLEADPYGVDVALCQIARDEEITIDYGLIEECGVR